MPVLDIQAPIGRIQGHRLENEVEWSYAGGIRTVDVYANLPLLSADRDRRFLL